MLIAANSRHVNYVLIISVESINMYMYMYNIGIVQSLRKYFTTLLGSTEYYLRLVNIVTKTLSHYVYLRVELSQLMYYYPSLCSLLAEPRQSKINLSSTRYIKYYVGMLT